MTVELKQLKDQVMVITGASSGIGLTTARLAAERGARLVLAARSENALRQLADGIITAGGEAIYIVADVANEEDIGRIADAAIDHFGGFDTWVNNAGVSLYGKLLDVPTEDMRRLFETNFWGLVYGSLTATRYLRRRGGALINIGSTFSDRATPLQGAYCASKHAVKGFTDALRVELESDRAPVSVTLIKPAAVNTQYTRNAKNYLNVEPQIPPPVYAPETVAHAILFCAETPRRDLFVGAGGKALSVMGQYAPRLTDKIMAMMFVIQQQSNRPPLPHDQNGLDRPSERLQERGDYEGHVAESSLYTQAALHPAVTGAVIGVGLAAAALWLTSDDGAKQHHVRKLTKR